MRATTPSLLSPSYSSARAPTRTVPTRISTFVSTRPSTSRTSRSPTVALKQAVTLGSTRGRRRQMNLPGSPLTRTLTPHRRRLRYKIFSSDGARDTDAVAMAKALLSRTTSIFAKIQPIGSRTRRTQVLKWATRRRNAKIGLKSITILKMKTLPSLGAATESRKRSSRTFSSWVPTSWVAAAPPNSPRATRTLCPERHPCSMSESSPSQQPSPFSWRKKSPQGHDPVNTAAKKDHHRLRASTATEERGESPPARRTIRLVSPATT